MLQDYSEWPNYCEWVKEEWSDYPLPEIALTWSVTLLSCTPWLALNTWTNSRWVNFVWVSDSKLARSITLKAVDWILRSILVYTETTEAYRWASMQLYFWWKNEEAKISEKSGIALQEESRDLTESNSIIQQDQNGKNWRIVQPSNFTNAEIHSAMCHTLIASRELLWNIEVSNDTLDSSIQWSLTKLSQDIILVLWSYRNR